MSLEEFISALTKEDLEKRENKIPSLQFIVLR